MPAPYLAGSTAPSAVDLCLPMSARGTPDFQSCRGTQADPITDKDHLGEVLAVCLVLLCTVLFFYYLYRGWGMPPGPWGLPGLGFLPWLDPARPHLTLAELAHDYGPICSLRLGEVNAVLLSHPALVREALSKEVFAGRAPLWLTHGLMNDNGLIAVEGDKWREQRKFVVSCLKNLGVVRIGGKRDQMQERILTAVRESIKMLGQEEAGDDEEGIDPHKILAHTIGNLMNQLIFGVSFPVDDETWQWLQSLAEEGVKLVGVAGVINFIPILRYLPKYRRILDYVKSGQLRTHELYREFARESKPTDETLLAMYLEAMRDGRGRYFDDQQMVHLMADMFGAGLDTSLATLRWLLLYLAINTQAQDIAHEEIDSVTKKRKEPNLDDLQKCPYTEACILEAMRIRPVVPLGIPHGTLEDTTLVGYRIPKGTMIMVNQWALHHDVDHWKDPEVFNPRRFLSSEGTVKKSEYFNPFQNGKRVCIGEEMARMVLFLFTAGILKNYRLETVGDTSKALEGTSGITLSPGEHRLKFISRAAEARGSKGAKNKTSIFVETSKRDTET